MKIPAKNISHFIAGLYLLVTCGPLFSQSLISGPFDVFPSRTNTGNIIGTGVFSALNVGLSTANYLALDKEKDDPSNTGFFILSGLLQMGVGHFYYQKEPAFNAVNQISGGVTVATSILRIIKSTKHKHKQEDRVTLNPYCYPATNTMVAGLSLNVGF